MLGMLEACSQAHPVSQSGLSVTRGAVVWAPAQKAQPPWSCSRTTVQARHPQKPPTQPHAGRRRLPGAAQDCAAAARGAVCLRRGPPGQCAAVVRPGQGWQPGVLRPVHSEGEWGGWLVRGVVGFPLFLPDHKLQRPKVSCGQNVLETRVCVVVGGSFLPDHRASSSNGRRCPAASASRR